jgi:hypothetical protein
VPELAEERSLTTVSGEDYKRDVLTKQADRYLAVGRAYYVDEEAFLFDLLDENVPRWSKAQTHP